MLEKLQHYWLVISTFLLAVLAFLVLRKSGQIKDLQQQIIVGKMQDQLKTINQKTEEDSNDFNQAINRYNALRDSYHKLYGRDT